MAKKQEELVRCEKCNKKEARVKHVILDKNMQVYTTHPWVMMLLFVAIGIVGIPYLPEVWKIPVGVALGIVGAVVVVRVYNTRKSLPRGREMYCHSCYHFWWELDPVKNKPAKG
ncbi:MAG TPA: hypothetical protein VN364_11740 [Bellilinea sp.]|nr:hypothetical protein [Bellilinea sp.]